MDTLTNNLNGKRALIIGVANKRSLAWSIAENLSAAGAEIAISYQNERTAHRIKPLLETTNPTFTAQCDVSNENEINDLFTTLQSHWQRFDILVHAIAWADGQALANRVVEIGRDDFLNALDISVYSLIAFAQRAESFMKTNGGSIVSLSYHGAQKVIPGYNVMGIAKAALEHTVRYLAYDLGKNKIRVNAVSAGPIKTLSAAAMPQFNDKLDMAAEYAPLLENISAEDVAAMTGFLCGAGSKHITGGVHYVDSGLNILGA